VITAPVAAGADTDLREKRVVDATGAVITQVTFTPPQGAWANTCTPQFTATAGDVVEFGYAGPNVTTGYYVDDLQVTKVLPPSCTSSQSCPSAQPVPPNLNVQCTGTADFYEAPAPHWGTPSYLGTGTSISEATTAYSQYLLACAPGGTLQCVSFSMYSPTSSCAPTSGGGGKGCPKGTVDCGDGTCVRLVHGQGCL
jgi:hypothetical protein